MFNFSSFCSSCWIFSSSSKLVQMCAVLSYSLVNSLTSYTILFTCTRASYSLYSRTSRGVLGFNFSVNSTISCLNFSMVCAILYIFSYVVTYYVYAQYGMLLYTFESFFSNLSVHYFSSSFSSVICSHVTCKISFTSWSSARLVASALALDHTSCITLVCNPYNSFVGIFARTTSKCSMSFTALFVVFSSLVSL